MYISVEKMSSIYLEGSEFRDLVGERILPAGQAFSGN